MRNIVVWIEYEGTAFHGWQRQPGLRTVQGVVEDAVRDIFRQEAAVTGAGRTDAGVHAQDYPCNFLVESEMAIARIPRALMARLPDDVIVQRAEERPMGFSARFDALSRRYAYRIDRRPTALGRRTAWHCRNPLDAERMRAAAPLLCGAHDFTSFTLAQNAADPTCHVLGIEVTDDADSVTMAMEANRFVHNMVRIIAGTLVEVGRGRMEPERVAGILRTRDRRAAGPTLPPHGLCFLGARYPDGPKLAATEAAPRGMLGGRKDKV